MSIQTDKQIGQPPIEAPFIGPAGNITPIWLQWLNHLKPTLESSMNNQALNAPNVTTTQAAANPNIRNGDIFYNNTVHKYQCRENGVLKTFKTT